MPARTRRSGGATGTNPAEDDVTAASSSPVPGEHNSSSPAAVNGAASIPRAGIKFNQPLSWRAGRPIPVAELLKRLQALADEMRDLDQEEDESIKESLGKFAKELADQQLLGHKDKGVRAWTARCAVDVLRLCAPDAPFTSKQLRAIFDLIVRFILPALSDPSQPYNQQHVDVLESLAQVKSIVLINDVPHADDLITEIFSAFFDIVSGTSKASTGEQITKAVHLHMTSILVVLVDEAQIIPQDAVDIMVAQFLRVDPNALSVGDGKVKKKSFDPSQPTLAMKELPQAYLMARTICLTCQDKMAREISKYFNDVIVDASGTSLDRRDNVDADELGDGLNEDSLKELDKAHRLLRELWRACPLVLQNVVPQLEAELGAENVRLRVLATETLGDMASGVGAAGPPTPPSFDPATYPPFDLSSLQKDQDQNPLTKPSSPQAFSQVHARAYASFLHRKQDKSSFVRSTWAIAVGRILSTSAGGMGLSQDEELRLVEDMARMLNDSDERVRLAAVQAIGAFAFKDVINKLGLIGGADKAGSVLGNLAERVKDRRSAVRTEAMNVFGRIWVSAFGEIAAGNEKVENLVGGIPSKILNTYYTNDQEIIVLMDKALFEVLLPLTYPPLKSKSNKQGNSLSQRVKDSQESANADSAAFDPDQVRAERMLILAKGLDERAKKIFFALCQRQTSMTKFMQAYLQACEDYNGGVMDSNEVEIKDRLKKLINELTKLLPDPIKVSADLWKFAKTHDRRAYQLVRFAYTPESDFKTVHNAVKELSKKRIDPGLKETLLPLVYRTSVILYNRNHVPAILDYSRTNDKGLSSISHEVLADISSRRPEVLKAHIRKVCTKLSENAPSASNTNPVDSVNDLKACASFAKKFPKEIPQERVFRQAMTNFALFGSPPEAAKHAVSVIMSSSNKKEMLAKDLAQQCVKGLAYGKPGFLSRLAAISRLWLLAPEEVDAEADTIVDFVVKEVLLQNRSPSVSVPSQYAWSDEFDEECLAKCWGIRILVNRVRSHIANDQLKAVVDPIYDLLTKLVESEGELSKKEDTPESHRPRLRLLAACSLLKLCQSKKHDALFTPKAFNSLALVAQDNTPEVRKPFLFRLRKYLGRNTLPARFYTIPFLLAFEPITAFKTETVTWLKSRAGILAVYHTQGNAVNKETDSKITQNKATILENTLARLLSLLAHHPDYEDETLELVDISRYVVFYLLVVANDKNISLIYHIAQRVKNSRDVVGSAPPEDVGIDHTQRLHVLSDLAMYTIRSFIEIHNWNLLSLPGRVSLPSSLFGEIKDHDASISAVSKNLLTEEVENGIDSVVRQSMRKGGASSGGSKKRKSESDNGPVPKKTKSDKLPVRAKEKKEKKEKQTKNKKPPKRKAAEWDNASNDASENDEASKTKRRNPENAARRKSGRASGTVTATSYRERDDSEDDAEMEEANGNSDEEVEEESGHSTEAESEQEVEEDIDEPQEEDKGLRSPNKGRNGIKTNDVRDVDMRDADDDNDEELDVGEDDELALPEPTPRRRAPSSKTDAKATNSKATPAKQAPSQTARSSGSKRTSKAQSKGSSSSPVQAKSKRTATKTTTNPPATKAEGRVTRSRG